MGDAQVGLWLFYTIPCIKNSMFCPIDCHKSEELYPWKVDNSVIFILKIAVFLIILANFSPGIFCLTVYFSETNATTLE